jgi:RTX calcium-binding nonapeptide repeat (4 copies)
MTSRRATHRAALLSGTAAAMLAAAALAGAAPAEAARATCHGFPVTTPKSSGDITGTNRRDVIRLTGPGRVRTGAGPDIICGSRFADEIEAGAGRDVVLGGAGPDHIRGGAGRDYLFGEGGRDHLVGGPGGDTLHGGPGADRVVRGDGGRAGENGRMSTQDVVLSGSRGISIIAEGPALENLLMSNTSFAFDWIPTGGLAEQMMGLGLAWQVVRPWMMNVVTVDDRAGAFWASPGSEPMPGLQVSVTEQVPVTWGARMALMPTGVLLGVPGGMSNAVEVMNQVGSQNVVGLSIGGSANGQSQVNPAFATMLPAWSIAPFRQPTSLRLRTANPGTQPGQWLTPPSPDQQQATVTFGGAQSIATFRVMPDGSFLRG